MRWDNPIVPDWFAFPDLASFPEYANEPRNGNASFDPDMLLDFIVRGDANGFLRQITRFTGEIPWIGKLAWAFNHVVTYRGQSAYPVDNPCGADLYEKGMHVTRINLSKFDVRDEVDQLLAKPDWLPQPGSYDRGMSLTPYHAQVIQSLFEQAGIMEGVNQYSGKKRAVKTVFLHVSHPTDRHYKQFFMDAKMTPRWTNTHIDPKEDVVKAIVYLEDINEHNGAFGFVPESHRYVYPAYQEILGRAITTGNYCKTPKERSTVFGLPAPLRVSYNFGRCVMDDSQLAKELDDRLVRVTSDMGNTTIFDAGAGMHQGGIVEYGRRVSLQVLMK